MEIKKAKSQQQKLQRTNTILDAAESLFAESNGELPSAIQIANKAKIAKGTVYLYFSTKEAIFITLLERHIQNWLLGLDKSMRQYEQPSVDDVCVYLLQYWTDHPQLGQLYRISDACLEPNVDEKTFSGFQTRKINEMKRLVPAFQELNKEILPQEWAELIQLSLSLLGVAWQKSHPQQSSLESANFKLEAEKLLKPFWMEVVNRKTVVEKPKSKWRKLLGQ